MHWQTLQQLELVPHKGILKIMGQIQAKTGEIPTLDDALQEMPSNYRKKSKAKELF